MLGITPGLLLTVYVAGKQLPFQLLGAHQTICDRYSRPIASIDSDMTLGMGWGTESDRIIIATPSSRIYCELWSGGEV